jgi:two-component system sensor histidine kinase KdpD
MPPVTLRFGGRLPARESVLSWLPWFLLLAAVTGAMIGFRARLDKAHIALAYLLVVLVASSRAKRAIGLTLSVVAFLAFNFFFLPPYHTFVVNDPVDWLVLGAFLLTSVVAAQLLTRAQSEASAAWQRTLELDRLSAVGAEALNAGRAEEALEAIADVIRKTLGVERCEIYLRDETLGSIEMAAASGTAGSGDVTTPPARGGEIPSEAGAQGYVVPTGERLVEWVAGSGQAVIQLVDGTMRVAAAEPPDGQGEIDALNLANARILLLPLRVRARTVGVLRIAHASALALDLPRRRFVEALSYYAALGVERVRLVAQAERAEALRKTDELKNALLASVSHDLRTPLTTIKALAHDIRLEGDERAAIIEEEADRLTRFVADLLDLSRLAGGAFTVTLEINAAEDLIGAALQRAAGALTHHTVDVQLGPAEPMLLGKFDFVHALRVLVNLIENAVKYSPAGSTIELRAARVGDMLELAVLDRGIGVPAGEQDRIFEPFHRPAGGSPDAGGAGLGLSIARRMAEAQGGGVRYAPRPGGGSVFTFFVPIADLSHVELADGKSL